MNRLMHNLQAALAVALMAVLLACTVAQNHHHDHDGHMCVCLAPAHHCHEHDDACHEAAEADHACQHHSHGDAEGCTAHIDPIIATDETLLAVAIGWALAGDKYYIGMLGIEVSEPAEYALCAPPLCRDGEGAVISRRGPPFC